MAGHPSRLNRVITAQPYVDHFGDRHTNRKYVTVVERIDVFPNGEIKHLDDGYQKWTQEILESTDGRTWVYIGNRISYHGGGWYKPLFDVGDDRCQYHDDVQMLSNRCVDKEGRAVDTEGNRI